MDDNGMRTHHWGALYPDPPAPRNGNNGLNLQLMSPMNDRNVDTKQLLVSNSGSGIAGNHGGGGGGGSILQHRDKPFFSNVGGIGIGTGFFHSNRGECMPDASQQPMFLRQGWYRQTEHHNHGHHHYGHGDGKMHYSIPGAAVAGTSTQHYGLMSDTHGMQTLQMMQMMQTPDVPLQSKEEPAAPNAGVVEVIEEPPRQEVKVEATKKKRGASKQPKTGSPKPKKPRKIAAPKEPNSNGNGKGKGLSSRGKEVKNVEVVINGMDIDLSCLPTPVCSCTGMPQQCYRWGIGGWQSACCTTTISAHPLPMSTKRRGARIAGRKMSQGAFKKVLEKLAGEGFNLANPIDLRTFWAKHGTNKFVTIR